MSLHFFFVPASRPGAAQEELNAFLHQERVVALSREFVADGPNSGWAVCVEVTAGPRELPASLRANPPARRSESVDYKQVLSPEDFDLYAALREQRKALSQLLRPARCAAPGAVANRKNPGVLVAAGGKCRPRTLPGCFVRLWRG